jgi:hypothetical protein
MSAEPVSGYHLAPPKKNHLRRLGPLTEQPELLQAAADANREAERAIARPRSRGAKGRELDEAESRPAVEYGRLAGEKWLSYETSSGKEEIERLRGRADNPTSVARAIRRIREIADREFTPSRLRGAVSLRRHADHAMDRIWSSPRASRRSPRCRGCGDAGLYYRRVWQWINGAWKVAFEGHVRAFGMTCSFEGPTYCSVNPPYIVERWWRHGRDLGHGGSSVLNAGERGNWQA